MARPLPRRHVIIVVLAVLALSCVATVVVTATTPWQSSSFTSSNAVKKLVAAARPKQPQGGIGMYEHDAISLSRSKFSRWKQRCRHRRLTQRVPRAKAKVDSAGRRGTCLRLVFSLGPKGNRDSVRQQQRREDAIIAELFGSDRHSTHHPAPFNHNMVGMTNPCLHIGVRDRTLLTIPASSSSSSSPCALDEDRSWWPGTACHDDAAWSENNDEGSINSAYSGWNVLCLRRRVGKSHGCYQAVRDAALQWEFDCGDVGIAAVSSLAMRRRRTRIRGDATSETESAGYSIAPGYSRVDASESNLSAAPSLRSAVTTEEEDFDAFHPTDSDQVQQIWSGPGSRRLVTYTAVPSKGPVRLVAMNPVGVVYDFVDQRGLDGSTTYTSTAYATLKGHWLTGEERVTVALRDNGSVDVEILSFSRPSPSSWAGRAVWPFVGGMQRRFFQKQLDALERVASQATIPQLSGSPMQAMQ